MPVQLRPKKLRPKAKPTRWLELTLNRRGSKVVVGVDEAGRGAWAGAVVAAAVIWPADKRLPAGINDSKQLTPMRREELFEVIYKEALAVGVGMASVAEIDKVGVGRATHLAMHRAIEDLNMAADVILVDGWKVNFVQAPSIGIIDGDRSSISIAAASVVAKVVRDRLMVALHNKYPRFGFALHKGYGTKLHQDRIASHGVCREHRHSFEPIRRALHSSQTNQLTIA